jgi:hypothetical protein
MFLVKICLDNLSALSLDNGCVFLVKDYRKPMYKADNRVYICDVKHLNGLEEAVKRLKSEAET